MRALNIGLFVAVFLFISNWSGPVHAYLDPGTGSMVFQLLLGGFVGALVAVKLYWQKLKAFFLGRKDRSPH